MRVVGKAGFGGQPREIPGASVLIREQTEKPTKSQHAGQRAGPIPDRRGETSQELPLAGCSPPLEALPERRWCWR
jgi:hypothetical protein